MAPQDGSAPPTTVLETVMFLITPLRLVYSNKMEHHERFELSSIAYKAIASPEMLMVHILKNGGRHRNRI